MNKALLVGINKYPDAPLKGCINDITDMADLIRTKYGFTEADVRTLVDGNATAAAIKDGLKWLMDGANASSRLLFHYSGHGTRMPVQHDVLDAICPVDFDWSPQHALTSLDFSYLFAEIPEGVEFNWFSDSCHSGKLTREGARPDRRPRWLIPPDEVQAQILENLKRPAPRFFKLRSAVPLNGGFISGCASDETSADAAFKVDGKVRYNGAFTYFLVRQIRSQPSISLINLTKAVFNDLRSNDFDRQTPQVHGSEMITSQPMLGGTVAPAQRVVTDSVLRLVKEPHLAEILFGQGAARPATRARSNGHLRPEHSSMHMPAPGGNMCEVTCDAGVFDGKTDDQVLVYFRDVVAPEMCSNYFIARDATAGGQARGGSISIGASTEGGGGVHIGGTWSF